MVWYSEASTGYSIILLPHFQVWGAFPKRFLTDVQIREGKQLGQGDTAWDGYKPPISWFFGSRNNARLSTWRAGWVVEGAINSAGRQSLSLSPKDQRRENFLLCLCVSRGEPSWNEDSAVVTQNRCSKKVTNLRLINVLP